MDPELRDHLDQGLPRGTGQLDLAAIDADVARRRRSRRLSAGGVGLALVALVAVAVVDPGRPVPRVDPVAPGTDAPTPVPSAAASPSPASPTDDETVTSPAPGTVDVLRAVAPLGGDGLAEQRGDDLVLTRLDGEVLATLPGVTLVSGESRDGLGGPLLVTVGDGSAHWLDPAGGSSLPAEGVTPVGRIGLVEDPAGTWRAPTEPWLPAFAGPISVANAGRLVTGSGCDTDGCGAPSFVDLDMGGVGTTDPGCVATDGFGDLNQLEVCDDGTTTFVRGRLVDGPVRWDAPRYAGQPDDRPSAVRVTDAVFGPTGVVVQLGTECEVPRVAVLPFEGGPATDPWGGTRWEDGPPEAVLLGTTTATGVGSVVPLVQVRTGPCSEVGTVQQGVWALGEEGPTLLSDQTAPVALWTDRAADLDELGAALATAAATEAACDGPPDPDLGRPVDLDGDGRDDRVVTDAGGGAPPLVACLGDGRALGYDGGPVARVAAVRLGEVDALALGTDAVELVRVIGDDLVPLVPVEAADFTDGTGLRFAQGTGEEDGVPFAAGWGCRRGGPGTDAEVVSVVARRDGAGATVTVQVHDVAAATLDLVEDRTSTTTAATPDLTALVATTLASESATPTCTTD